MMNESSKSGPTALEEAQQVQRWVRRYAQNRSLPVAVGLVVYAILFLAISVPSYWGGVAYRDGNTVLFAVCLGIVILALVATVYIAIPAWGGRRLQELGSRLYADEGQVTLATPHARGWILIALATGFAVCVVGSVILSVLEYLPVGKFQQPISAIYVVPFLVALNYLMRPMAGPIALLWPVLYAVHAVLVLAGVPIVFTGRWESLNMLLPMVGYGLVTAIIGHLYSRWALHSVRTIVSRQLDRAELVEDGEPR
jgi:hypothetical protein